MEPSAAGRSPVQPDTGLTCRRLLAVQLRGHGLVPFFFDKQVLLMETLLHIWRCERAVSISNIIAVPSALSTHHTRASPRRVMIDLLLGKQGFLQVSFKTLTSMGTFDTAHHKYTPPELR